MAESRSRRVAIATRLALARKHAGLSQGQVARMLGLHRPSISEVEAGRRKISAEELVEFARIYGVSVDWLACVDTTKPDSRKDGMLLAARTLNKLKKEDLKRVLLVLEAFGKPGGLSEERSK